MKNKVKAIPDGYNNITPYLALNNAKQAIKFYKKIFNAVEILRIDSSDGKIAHSELQIGDSKLMVADPCAETNPQSSAQANSTFSILLYVEDVDAIVEEAIAAGAKIIQPIENKYYGDRSAMLLDPFGCMWCVATHIEDVPIDKLKNLETLKEKI